LRLPLSIVRSGAKPAKQALPNRAGASSRTPRGRFADPTEYTPHFTHRDGLAATREVCCEGVPLSRIAESTGTPVYVYSAASIRDAYRRLDRAFAGLPHSLCYSVKANSNLSILRLLARLGSRFDIVSGGELYRLQRAGISPQRVVFSGVGKSREEMRAALRAGILVFNVESEAELEMLAGEASRLRVVAPAGLRVNPDVSAGGHPHISTGARSHKFGVDWEDARRLYLEWQNSRWIRWEGISAHIGSQILSVRPFAQAAERLAAFARTLAWRGIALRYFDFGGGVGIRYTREQPLRLADYARVLKHAVRAASAGPAGSAARRPPLRLLLEPGRVLLGPAGVLLTRVLLTKQNRGKSFVVVDAAMNDFLRPALYHATHPITHAERSEGSGARGEGRGGRTQNAELRTQTMAIKNHDSSIITRHDVVGPICETGDCFLQDWPLGEARSGDLLILWGAGAYGSVAASHYNSRPRPIRRRETMEQVLSGEPKS
jgi:diaminopimelate decarboxylase